MLDIGPIEKSQKNSIDVYIVGPMFQIPMMNQGDSFVVASSAAPTSKLIVLFRTTPNYKGTL